MILDGYVDEPARLGVPPYLSPYPRYIAGLLEDNGIAWEYRTVDQWRHDVKAGGQGPEFFSPFDIVIVIFGAVVPGTYIRTRPMSFKECITIGESLRMPSYLLGPGVLGSLAMLRQDDINRMKQAYSEILLGIADTSLARALGLDECRWSQHAVSGAKVVLQTWKYPIAEIDTYLGCHRYIDGGCSFCIEPTYGRPQIRSIDEIVWEIKALYDYGVRHFRIGGQSCIFSYGATVDGNEIHLAPESLEHLFRSIWKSAPEIKVLHVDNANPTSILRPGGKEILDTLLEYTTPGNVLAFGMESADPVVIERNNLNTSPEDVLKAVELVNEKGRIIGENGMPRLLPGINILNGLPGETADTFRLNLEFLKTLVDRGLWLRRIAIRSVLPVRAGFRPEKKWKNYNRDLKRFKHQVRYSIEAPLLEDMFPVGRVIRDVLLELNVPGGTIGRQLGSYPIAVYFPYDMPINVFKDAVVTGHRERSLTAIEYGLNLNLAPMKVLRAVPGIGRRRALNIAAKRPFTSLEELADIGLNDSEINALKSMGVTC